MQPTHPVQGAGPVSELVSCSYYKLQPTGHLKTTELYSLSSVGQKSEIKALAGPYPRQALRQKSSCTSVVASGGSMCSLACGRLPPILVSVCLPLIKILSLDLGTPGIQDDLISRSFFLFLAAPSGMWNLPN